MMGWWETPRMAVKPGRCQPTIQRRWRSAAFREAKTMALSEEDIREAAQPGWRSRVSGLSGIICTMMSTTSFEIG